MRAVRAGSKRGLCYEAKILWEECGRADQWEARVRRTEGRKQFIRDAAKKIATSRLIKILSDNNERDGGYYSDLSSGRMGREEHLSWGTKNQQGLMSMFKANSSHCRGIKRQMS